MADLQRCAGCGTHRNAMRQVLDLGDSPLADEFPKTPDAPLDRWPLTLVRCPGCTMVQLGTVVPDDILWAGDYGFYTGASSVAVAQQTAYAGQVMADWPDLCSRGVVEIACNDGSMLEAFVAAGHPAWGIDPAAGPVAAARRTGLDVTLAPFTAAAAVELVNRIGHLPGVVVANNVIAHVADLSDFIVGLSYLIRDDRVGMVEFQYLPDLILGNQIDHVYHEHRRFLSLNAINRALRHHGLHVTHVDQTSPQGGSLRCAIRGLAFLPDETVTMLSASERWLEEPHALGGLQGRADRLRERLVNMLTDLRRQGLRVAAYGASAKATTLLNWCRIGPDLVQYVVDTTPTKHGRYMPGTGIPIVSPSADSRAPDIYLLTVWNYQSAVMRRETAFTSSGGRWLIPIPTPVLL